MTITLIPPYDTSTASYGYKMLTLIASHLSMHSIGPSQNAFLLKKMKRLHSTRIDTGKPPANSPHMDWTQRPAVDV